MSVSDNFVENSALEESPIFVRGISRSGGTLMATILDASSEIAMSYEIYPDLLIPGGLKCSQAEWGDKSLNEETVDREIIRLLASLGRDGALEILKSIRASNLSQFLLRAERSGLTFEEICSCISEVGLDTKGGDGVTKRLEQMAAVARKKMANEGKGRWGAKCSGDFESYARMWSSSQFVNVIRDPRDILASQLNTGRFNPDPQELARSWVSAHQKFRRLAREGSINGLEVSYEELCKNTSETIRKVFKFLGLRFDPDALNYASKSLSIHRTPNGHLSKDRVSRPVDQTMIGRWQRDLTHQQANEIMILVGDAFEDFVWDDSA